MIKTNNEIGYRVIYGARGAHFRRDGQEETILSRDVDKVRRDS